MTEFEKMSAGKLYDPSDKELATMRLNAHKWSKDYNDTYEDEEEKRAEIVKKLCPNLGKGTYLQGPVQFDYGVNFFTGTGCYANFNLTVLDCAPVRLGNDVFIGPNCQLVPPIHPLLNEERKMYSKEDGTMTDREYAKPIVIKDGCWLASGVTVCGGVTIGRHCVIGAGSVVTRDIPDGVFAAGNPCRVIRKITKEDSVYLKKELF
ncbi:MAG: sugar O-acetyltransferase [Clostridia bacterium]|nr:sugar O-acetyltransferase [Clostridia bacterium]MBP3422526.1 sugar O-acetyltransferase [Clostridia bacterium]